MHRSQPTSAQPPKKSSRVCVKNLPKHLNEKRLKEVFEQKGTVTDVKILRTKAGESRRLGFVGFSDESNAKAAKNYLNNTFIDTSRISVEFAIPIGDERLARPWSKYSRGSSQHMRNHPEEYADERHKSRPAKESKQSEWQQKMALAEKSEEFKEFLSVVQPRSKSKFWGNDAGIATVEAVESKKPGGQGVFYKKVHKRFDVEKPADDEVVNAVDVSDSDSDDEAFDNPMVDAANNGASASAGDDNDDSADDDALQETSEPTPTSKSNDMFADVDSDSEESGDMQASNLRTKNKKNEEEEVPDASETGRIFVRNLSYAVREDELVKLFSKFGEVSELVLPVDDIGRSKGFALVQFMLGECAVKAMHDLDGKVFQGRLLHILPAKPRPERADVSADQEGGEASTYKKNAELKRRREGQSEHNWNTLFIRSDAVAAAAAQRHGVSKGEILDADADNVAVRMALAETQTIAETKAFLLENGVSVGAFDGVKTKERSKTCILVKNVPFASDEAELRALFEAHGSIGRFLTPPSKCMAIVEFLEAREARQAFRALAYKKFEHVPLYLEWAPIKVFAESYSAANESKANATTASKDRMAVVADVVDDAPSDEEGMDTSTLFVKNLSFKTVESTLIHVFERIGSVRSVVIANKTVAGTAGQSSKKLSRGYGFVEFSDSKAALRALKKLQGTMVDGHALQLKISNRQSTEQKSSSKKRRQDATDSSAKMSATKLVVKNVPFEAKVKELRDLFATFGQVKSCRIPKKFGGGHRGFAFVEFTTKQEARTAFESLSSTHLYGRHLVLGWAQESESLDDLRAKASEQLSGLSDRKRRRVEDVENSDRAFLSGLIV